MITNWLFWPVPEQYVMRYLVILLLVMFMIPTFIFGMQFTRLGFVMNLVWYDIIWYGWVKSKEASEREDK
jgi:Ca2+/Na+ antiporter